MIDIISSSIRFGKTLRGHEELNLLYRFLSEIIGKERDIEGSEYVQLLSKNFSQYGFYSFDVVNQIIEQNLDSKNDMAKTLASSIKSFVTGKECYDEVLNKSKKYGAILDKYVFQLLSEINDYPMMDLENASLKIQQCSNELSTAVLRSGVLSWISDPQKIAFLQKEQSFVSEYEKKTAPFDHIHPYNEKTLKVINSYSGNKRKIAQHIENIKFVQFLVKCSILQGFFFELFEIPVSHITKIKEIYKDQSIHPVIIKTDFIYPNNHLFLFKYTWDGRVSYLLTKRMTMHFSHNKGSTTLYGYCYPTNEFSLLKVN